MRTRELNYGIGSVVCLWCEASSDFRAGSLCLYYALFVLSVLQVCGSLIPLAALNSPSGLTTVSFAFVSPLPVVSHFYVGDSA